MNINVHIERLIFNNPLVAQSETGLVQAAVERELGRLLARELFASTSSFAQARVAAGDIYISPGATARDLGVKIGRSVFRSLTQSGFELPKQAKRSPQHRFDESAYRRKSSELLETNQLENRSRSVASFDMARFRFSSSTQTNNQRR
jgi:hypothetical protein